MVNLGRISEILSPIPKVNIFASAIIGGSIGLIGSLIVNACLLEISLNGFFTVYFSLIFITVGAFMLYRSRQREEQSANAPVDNEQTFMREEKNMFFQYASGFVLLSGVLCLLLERNWARSFPYILKVPIYGMVAMSLNYLVLFAIIDLVNFVCSYLQSENSLNVVESNDQILTLLATCFGTGLLYGLIFSLMDVQDASMGTIRQRFFYEETLCVPIGIIGGIVGGIANEVLRKNVSSIDNTGWKNIHHHQWKT